MNTKDIRTVLQLGDFLPPAWLFAGAIFSFFWGIALILSSSKYNLSDPRFLFGILLGILSLWMGNGALFFGNMYLEFPMLFGIHIPFALLCGPLLLVYYSSLFKGESDKIYLFHFFPSLISVLLFIPFWILSTDEKLVWLKQALSPDKTFYHGLILSLNLLIKISNLVYIFYILYMNRFLFFLHFEATKQNYKVFLYWLLPTFFDLLIGFIGYVLKDFRLILLSALYLPFSIYILFIISQKYPKLLDQIQEQIKKKYDKSKLKGINVEFIIKKMDDLMISDKYFADEDLNISKFSEELELSVHQVSEILNEKLGKNFNQYINEFRVEESKKLLIDEPDRSVLSIGYAVGFNSKSAFNRTFKSFVQLTPIEYKNKYYIGNKKDSKS